MTSGPLWELEPDECVLILRSGTLVCIRAHNTCQPQHKPTDPLRTHRDQQAQDPRNG